MASKRRSARRASVSSDVLREMRELPLLAKSDTNGLFKATMLTVNAVLREDRSAERKAYRVLERVVQRCERRYGVHPYFCETLADMCPDPVRSATLYKAGLQLAQRMDLPHMSASISLALAALACEQMDSYSKSYQILKKCRRELLSIKDVGYTKEYLRIVRFLAEHVPAKKVAELRL